MTEVLVEGERGCIGEGVRQNESNGEGKKEF